jgi:hypothetical protein
VNISWLNEFRTLVGVSLLQVSDICEQGKDSTYAIISLKYMNIMFVIGSDKTTLVYFSMVLILGILICFVFCSGPRQFWAGLVALSASDGYNGVMGT